MMKHIMAENEKYCVDLAVRGNRVAVVGKSGSGKTFLFTVLRELTTQGALSNCVFIDSNTAACALTDNIHDSVIVIDKMEQMSRVAKEHLMHCDTIFSHDVELNNCVIILTGGQELLFSPSPAAQLLADLKNDGRVHFSLRYTNER